MKISWMLALPVIAVSAGVTALVWGTRPSLGVAGLALLAWWIACTSSGSPMDRAYIEYLYFDDEMKQEFMKRASPEMRAEIEKRLKAEEKPNQSPGPTR